MNSYQKAKLISNKLIVIEADNNEAIVATIPYFANGIKQVKAINTEIETLSSQQNKDLTGITEDKNDMLNECIDYLIEVSGAVHSYAIGQSNKALQSLVDYTPSKVNKLDQHDVVDACTAVLAEAGKIPLADMIDAGIKAEELIKFDDLLTKLKGSTGTRREVGIDQSGITKRIAELFAQAEDIKQNTLDRLAPQFQRKSPEFFNKYKAAANVIYHHSAHKTAPQPEVKA